MRYLLHGSARRDGDRIRVTAQLIEAESGAHIWAERYDRDWKNVFAVQDEITLAVAAAIVPAVADAEMFRAMHRTSSLGAWDFYMQGLWHLANATPVETDKARGLFERAIELDPLFALPHSVLSAVYVRAGVLYLTMPLDEAIRLATVHARKAVELGPSDAYAQSVLAHALMFGGDVDNAQVIARYALSINPNSARAHFVMGYILIFTGRTAEGRQTLGTFARLSPRDAGMAVARYPIIVSYYFDHDYEQCVEAARLLLGPHTGHTLTYSTYRVLAAALGQLGRAEEARAALEKALTLAPREFELYVHNRAPWMRSEDYEHLLEGLRKAGWQG